MKQKRAQTFVGTGTLITVAIIIMLVIGVAMWGMPKYRVYSLELRGKAALKEAEWSRQIQITEAQAQKDSATLKKETDIIRAEGVAESNKIIAESLTEEYIRWKWVEGLSDGSSEVIYVATEAGLPILEANRIA